MARKCAPQTSAPAGTEPGLAPAPAEPPSPPPPPPPAGRRRSDRFLQTLARYRRAVFVSHVHPDPDSLASMLGLAHLAGAKLGLPTLLTRDGPIRRAENRAMVEGLQLDLTPVQQVKWRPGDAVVMVDSQPGTGRHSLCASTPVAAVLDHHDTPGNLADVPFVDVRPHLGATCTLVTKYLTDQNVGIDAKLATALLYGIETEVSGHPREAGPCDDAALKLLYPVADKDLISQIRNARLPHSHFECVLQALQSSFIYDRLIISWIDDLPQPESAAEVCDFMVRFEKIDWAVCVGVHQKSMVLSVRSSLPHARAGELLQKVVGDLGKAGGHDRRAGGCIPVPNPTAANVEELQSELRRRFLREFGMEDARGQRLVRLREMLQNLQA